VVEPLATRFVGRSEVLDLIALAAAAGEHLFLYGPPGTAKSAVVRAFARAVQCRYFEYLLTRFSEPNEIFGPVDIARLREGVIATVTTGMLPEAEFAFLDELFNANSAILNNLLTVLNERIYRRGAEVHSLPLISVFAASNHLPDDDALQALFDRFLLRVRVDSLPRSQMPMLLASGWALEQSGTSESVEVAPLTADDLRELGRRALQVDLAPIQPTYVDAVQKVRDLGVQLTDRRAVKLLKLIAASAASCDRTQAQLSDLWVLRHIWDRAEQIGPLTTLIGTLLASEPAPEKPHPQAHRAEQVSAEALATELEQLKTQLQPSLKLLEAARLREQLQSLADRAAWVADTHARNHLLGQVQRLLGTLG
jgi:MoxR-like ATPase